MPLVLYPRTKEEVDREIAELRKTAKRILKTKGGVRKFMIEGGFLTKDGKLTKRYGG